MASAPLGYSESEKQSLALIVRLCSLARDNAPMPDLSTDEAKELAEVAVKEGVAGWVIHRITDCYQDWPSREGVSKALRGPAWSVVSHNAQVLGVSRDICERLKGFDTVLLKGAALIDSPYYEDVSHRVAGDIDIWVDPDKIEEARTLLIAAGAGLSDQDSHLESKIHQHLPSFKYLGLDIELHRSLFNKLSRNDLPGKLSDYSVVWHGRRMLNEKAMFYHLVMHGYGHYLHKETVLRWIVDYAVILTKSSDPEGLIAFCKASSPHAKKALEWAIGVTMDLLPEELAERMRKIGYAPLEFASHKTKHGSSIAHFKIHILACTLNDLRYNISEANGIQGKWQAVKDMAALEVKITRKKFPEDSLAVGLIKRIFIKK